MNIIMFMYGLNSQDCFTNIKSGLVLGQCILPHQQSHHISTRKIFHHEIQKFFILERAVKFDNTVAINLCKQIPFCLDMFNLNKFIGTVAINKHNQQKLPYNYMPIWISLSGTNTQLFGLLGDLSPFDKSIFTAFSKIKSILKLKKQLKSEAIMLLFRKSSK